MRPPIKCCTPWVSGGVLLGSLVVLTIALVLGLVVFPNAVESGVEDMTRLDLDTEQWDRFVELPFPLDFKINFLSVANPQEIIEGRKAIVEEMGPFVYKQNRKKRNITHDQEADRISYYQDQFFTFNEEASGNLTEDTTVTILNMPYMGLLQMTEKLPSDSFIDVESALVTMFDDGLFQNVKVKDILFNGIKICDPSKTTFPAKVLCLAMTLMNVKNMDYQPDGSMLYSLFKYKKESDDGLYTVGGGFSDIKNLGSILEWNGVTYTSGFWGDEENDCNSIRGTDSTIYPPFNDEDSSFDIFSTDIYRAVPIYYHKDITYRDIEGKRYGVHEDVFWADFPDESCYCTYETRGFDGNQSCFLDGTVDVGSVFGVPTILSLPHFLYADERYTNAIDGLNPQEDQHYTYVDLEPYTGTPLTGSKKIQISMILRPVVNGDGFFTQTRNLREAALPVFWMDEGMQLTDEYIEVLNHDYFRILHILSGVKWALIALAIVGFVIGGLFLCCVLFVFKA